MIQEIPFAFLHVIISQWCDIIRENIIGRNILSLPDGFLGSVRPMILSIPNTVVINAPDSLISEM